MTASYMEMPNGMHTKPSGWMKTYLDKMLNGLTGNLRELFYPFDTDCWLKSSFQDGGMEGWWPYEQAAYWLDGYIKCSYFARNEEHFQKAKKMIDAALCVVDESGFVGASDLKEQGLGNQWVHAVFFRAVLFLYEITGEQHYLDSVRNHYLSNTNDYANWRESVNIENMAVCYLKCGDERLKKLALKAYEAHCNIENNIETKMEDYFKDKPIDLHGVTYNEMLKIPVLLYAITGESSYLEAAQKGLERIHRHHLLPIGIHSASEFFGGTSAISCVETCDISDHTWTLGYFATITGNTQYLDTIERIMYNVAPSVMDAEFKSLQYYSSMNHVISTRNSNHSGSFTQTPRTAYQSNHYPECCTGNSNRSMPNFLYRSLMKMKDAYSFNFYIPCEYTADGKTFIVETNYPFEETVRITYAGENTQMRLQCRIPIWCKDFEFNCKQSAKISDNWLIIAGEFQNGDTIELTLRSNLETLKTKEGFLVQKQPLVYTLKIGTEVSIDVDEPRQTPEYPSYNITPTTSWQIALEENLFHETAKLTGIKSDDLLTNDYEITAKGYLLEDVDFKYIHSSDVPISDYDKGEIVKLREMGQLIYDGEMIFTPDISELKPTGIKQTDITLVPYSTATLRWTIFPDAKLF